MPRDRTLAAAFARAAVVCGSTALLVIAAGGGQAFWLCVPAALLLGASARRGRGATAGAALAFAAGAAPELASRSLGPLPSPVLAVVVLGSSVAIQHAVQSRLHAERRALRTAALTDPLTGAANRRALAERVEYEIARHSRQNHRFTVLVLDLDGFKLVNDRFGHHAGDELLRDVAAALSSVVREQDTVARLGGDEFCVLAPETDAAGARHLATRVSGAIRGVTAGLDALGASIGFAVFPDHGRHAAALLAAADDAAVAAKRRARTGGGARSRAA